MLKPILAIFDPDLPHHIYAGADINEKRKKAIYLECLAIKEAVKYWQHWLIGQKFKVYSDHKPLKNNIRVRTGQELGYFTYRN